MAALFLLNSEAGRGWAARGLPLDDTWIHLVYARGLAEQGGFFYNPGQVEAGMSSPLWVILLAIPLKLGAPAAAAAKSLSLIFGLFVPWMVYHLASEVGGNTRVGWIAGIATALEPNLAYARVSGMEVNLLAFLLCLALWFSVRRKDLHCGLALGLAVITRGEAALFVMLVGGIRLAEEYARREQVSFLTANELRLILHLFLPCLILGGAWAAFNAAVSGHLLPNTFYVKHTFGLGWIAPRNLYNIWMGYFRHAAYTRMGLALGFLVLAGTGAVMIVRRLGVRAAPLLLAPWLLIYALSINMAVHPEPWNFTARRYLDFLWPLLILSTSIGGWELWRLAKAQRARVVVLTAPLIAAALVGGGAWSAAAGARSLAGEYSWNCRNIEEVSVAMGHWVAENVSPVARVGVTDAGAVRFFGGHTTIDFLGLNNHEAIGRPLEELILEARPEVVVLFRSPEIDSWPFLTELYHLQAERNTILGGADLVAYAVEGER
jgi:hypothetical protein